MRVAGGLLVILLCTGCAPTIKEVALPAPTPPPTHSIAVAPSLPPSSPPSSPATPTPAPPLPPTAAPPSNAVPRPPASPPSAATPLAPPARPLAPALAPTPAPAPPATPAPLPAAPPRVLSTGVEDEQRMRRDAQTRIDGAERLVRDIDRKKLVERQQEQNLETIQSFLSKAKEALSAEDPQRAFTLADKAYLLADELSRHLVPR